MNFSPDWTITDIAVTERQHIVTVDIAQGIDQNDLVINRFFNITKAFKTSVKTGEIIFTLISTLYDLGIYIVLHNTYIIHR